MLAFALIVICTLILILGNVLGSRRIIYMDNNANMPPSTETMSAVAKYSKYGNYSAFYNDPRLLPQLDARMNAALAADFAYLFAYGSGATEANANVFHSLIEYYPGKPHIITSAYEHPNTLKYLTIKQDRGAIDLTLISPVIIQSTIQLPADQFISAIRPNTILISVMLVNNELGDNNTMLLNKLIRFRDTMAAESRFAIHSDITQAFMRIPIPPCDFLTGSFHKIGGPLGTGFLAYKPEWESILVKYPLIPGGDRVRGGTQNLPGLMGALAAINDYRYDPDKLAILKSHFYQEMSRRYGIVDYSKDITTCSSPILRFNVPDQLPGVILIAICTDKTNKEIRNYLHNRNIVIGIGSACARNYSPVMKSLGVPEYIARRILRISLHDNSVGDIDQLVQALSDCICSSDKKLCEQTRYTYGLT